MKIITFTGCSGSGKNYFVERFVESLKKESNIEVDFIVSCTTREKRAGETDGKDYHFMSNEQFEEMIKNNQLLEYVKVNDKYYGTPLLPNDKLYVHIIEPKGLELLKQDNRLEIQSVFLKDFSNGKLLKQRVKQRIENTTNQQEIIQHLKRLKHIEDVEIPEWNNKASSEKYNHIFSIQELSNSLILESKIKDLTKHVLECFKPKNLENKKASFKKH